MDCFLNIHYNLCTKQCSVNVHSIILEEALIGWCIVGKSVGAVQNLSGKMDVLPERHYFVKMK